MKTFVRDVCILISVTVCAIFCLGFVISQEYEERLTEMQAALLDSPVAEGYERKGYLVLSPFENVEIDVKSADVLIQIGEEYSLEYDLHHKEQVEKLEVVDGTFTFATKYCVNLETGQDDWQVVLTVPQDAPLQNLHVSSIAGTVQVCGRSFDTGVLHSNYGDIRLEDVSCSALELDSTLDSVRLLNCKADQIKVKTTTGNILLDGTFGTVSGESVIGTCTLRGVVEKEAALETLSGNIETVISNAGYRTETYGKILLNGREGAVLPAPTDRSPLLNLKSFSGGFDLRTEP